MVYRTKHNTLIILNLSHQQEATEIKVVFDNFGNYSYKIRDLNFHQTVLDIETNPYYYSLELPE